jgi:large subunit ribosomal protein L35
MKIKTKKAAAKRFRMSATGLVKFKRAGLRHNTGKVSRKAKRRRRQAGELGLRDTWHVAGVLPYGAR